MNTTADCLLWKATDSQWYLRVFGAYYGPACSEKELEEFLEDQFSLPGDRVHDESGTEPPAPPIFTMPITRRRLWRNGSPF